MRPKASSPVAFIGTVKSARWQFSGRSQAQTPFKHPYVVDGVPFDKGQMPPVGGGDAPGEQGRGLVAEKVGAARQVT